MLSDYLKEFVARADCDRYLGTATDDNVPRISYAAAARAVDDTRLEIYVQRRAAFFSGPTMAVGRRASFTVGHMMGSHEMYQVKGVIEAVRDPFDLREATAEYVRYSQQMIDDFGMNPDFKAKVADTSWEDGIAVVLRVEEIFGQTPGPGAGSRMEAS